MRFKPNQQVVCVKTKVEITSSSRYDGEYSRGMQGYIDGYATLGDGGVYAMVVITTQSGRPSHAIQMIPPYNLKPIGFVTPTVTFETQPQKP